MRTTVSTQGGTKSGVSEILTLTGATVGVSVQARLFVLLCTPSAELRDGVPRERRFVAVARCDGAH